MPDDALQSASSESVYVEEGLISSKFIWQHKDPKEVNTSRERQKQQYQTCKHDGRKRRHQIFLPPLVNDRPY